MLHVSRAFPSGRSTRQVGLEVEVEPREARAEDEEDHVQIVLEKRDEEVGQEDCGEKEGQRGRQKMVLQQSDQQGEQEDGHVQRVPEERVHPRQP